MLMSIIRLCLNIISFKQSMFEATDVRTNNDKNEITIQLILTFDKQSIPTECDKMESRHCFMF